MKRINRKTAELAGEIFFGIVWGIFFLATLWWSAFLG